MKKQVSVSAISTYFSLITCLVLLTHTISRAQSLISDSLYGVNGSNYLPISPTPGYAKMIDLHNGTVLYGGYHYDGNTDISHIDLYKADYCGFADTTFGTNGFAQHHFLLRNTVFDFNLQTDGKILTCGIQAPGGAASTFVPYVGRFLSNGSPDTSFGTMGSVSLRFDPVSFASGHFHGVTQLQDGRIVAAGLSWNNINGGISGFGAMRFLPDGSTDNTFSGDGIALYPIPVEGNSGACFVNSDNSILNVAAYRTNSNVTHFGVVAFDSTGSLLQSFGVGGLFLDSTDAISGIVHAVRDNSGNITMCSIKSGQQISMIRISPAGVPDPTFGTGGRATVSHPNIVYLNGIKRMSNNQLLVMGQSNLGTGYCVLVNSDGTIDSTFGTQGFMPVNINPITGTQYITSMSVLPNGQWLFGGIAEGFGSARYHTYSNVPHISLQGNYLQTSGTGTYQWYLNGNPISGATSDTLIMNQNGSYTVLLTSDYGCQYMSDPFIITTSSIKENHLASVNVFPNPSTGTFHVSTKHPINNVEIYDTMGKLVYKSNTVNGKEFTISPDLPAGVFNLYISNSAQSTNSKIVITD